MTLAVARLQTSLELRNRQAAAEQAAGDSLEAILDLLLLTVEAAADNDLLASILLLDSEGRRLLHGAAPSLPKAFCDAIHGSEIGPAAGSCGTAAYLGHAVYVTDIDTDPLWVNYRELASGHGLRACWSTPIKGAQGQLLGTFAIYHLTPRSPTGEELAAVRLITRYASEAIAACGAARFGAPADDGAERRWFLAAANDAPLEAVRAMAPAARPLWQGMQLIEHCRHQAEKAEKAGARGAAAFRAEMAATAREWRRLAREYERQLQGQDANPQT